VAISSSVGVYPIGSPHRLKNGIWLNCIMAEMEKPESLTELDLTAPIVGILDFNSDSTASIA
jgi:hypothetical protein